MSLRTAVVPAAGLGTRILPATKTIPKELLALVDRPMIQYVVEEAAAAGIERVVIVTRPGKTALAEYFAPAPELEAVLESKGRTDLLEAVRAPARLAEIVFATQDEPRGLGHAVWSARHHVGGEPFAVLLPDELFGSAGLLQRLAGVAARFEAPVIAVMEMAREEVSNYGVVDPEPVEADLVRIRGFVEKPPPRAAPSNLGSVGRYVLTPEVFEVLERTPPGSGGEIQLTDAVAALARDEAAYAVVWRGERHDAGRPLGYLKAIVELALARDGDLGRAFRAYLVERAKALSGPPGGGRRAPS